MIAEGVEALIRPIGDEAVRAKTGRGWDEWFLVLDQWGALTKAHKVIARFLHKEHQVPAWWSQMITVQYERERGRREVGQTTRGWEVSVQKTFAVSAVELWERLTSPEILCQWMAQGCSVKLAEGKHFKLPDGSEGEVRAVRPGRLLRFSLKPTRPGHSSTVDVTLMTTPSGKTALRFQHQGLPTLEERARMREYWRGVLESLV